MKTFSQTSKIFLFSFLSIISFLTFTSVTFAASNVPVGQACTPDNINQDRTCPYCPDKDGSRQFTFDWNFTWSDSRTPLCTVSCSIPSGTCNGALFRDEDGYAGGTALIKPTDKFIIFRDPKVGSTYQASCCVMNNGQCITTPVKSKKMTVTGCAQGCAENPFYSIVSQLNANQNVLITERDFDSWATKDIKDYQSSVFPTGFGSGDILNIKNQMESYQCYSGVAFKTGDNTLSALDVIEFLKINSNKKKATPLNVASFSEYIFPPGNYTHYISGGHVLIFLGINSHDSGYNNVNIKVLDSNIETGGSDNYLKDLRCRRTKLNCALDSVGDVSCRFLSPGNQDKAYICDYGKSRKFLLINQDRSNFDFDAISSNPIRENTAEWLRNIKNYPKISNFMGSLPITDKGICAGWALFILQVAYHGNFAGIDCHPDGSQSAIPKDDFLASVLTSITRRWSVPSD